MHMLDWPAVIHTSPTWTFVRVMTACPVRTSRFLADLLAGRGSKTTFQYPLASATTSLLCSPNLTCTLTPGSAQPQMGTGFSR